jgi:glycosyltransferase involved in cell wall biosynthesis
MTHPIQYYSPWFRFIEDRAKEIELRVLYATEPTPEQQGTGFDKGFEWDVPLREGYQNEILRESRPGDSFASDSFWSLNVPGLEEKLARTRPEVVLVSGWHSVMQLRGIRACRRRGLPLLYRGDSNLDGRNDGFAGVLRRFRTSRLLRCFTGYLSVGTKAREFLKAFGAPDDRIFPSPHAVDNDFFAKGAAPFLDRELRASLRREWQATPSEFVVLFVGKLEPNKRVEDLVRAVSRMKDEIRLLVVGSGSSEDSCRRLATEAGVRATWIGFLNQSELPRAYAAADCLALPSRETWGLVVNEAMATGLPCVVSDLAGCGPDLIENTRTGFVFRWGSVEELALSLDRMRSLRETSAFRREWCLEKVASHSFAAATEGLLAACRSVVAR